MNRYTADTNALFSYLADTLPPGADDVFSRAERGTASVQAPNIMFGEVFYRLQGGTVVDGVEVELTPQRAWQALSVNGPVSLAPFDRAAIRELLDVLPEFSMHDAVLVASHLAAETDAILTADPDIGGVRTIATIWE